MFKRYLHLLGLLALVYGSIITYTSVSPFETTLLLMLACGFLVKGSAMTKGQWQSLAIMLLLLWISAALFQATCEQRWYEIKQFEKQTVEVRGFVCAENPFKGDRTELKVEKITLPQLDRTSEKQVLTWLKGRKIQIQLQKNFESGGDNKTTTKSEVFKSRGGQHVQVDLKVVLPPRAGNPGFFDYRMYLALKDTWCTAYVDVRGLTWQNNREWLPQLREQIMVEIKTRLDRINVAESLGPSLGMLLGFDDFMSESSVSDYFMAGTVHVLTVSGFHFALVYAVLSGLMSKMPVPYVLRIALSVAFVLFFLLLTGIKFAPYRAGMSMLLMLSAPFFARRFDLATAASVIVLPELFANPYKAADMSLVLCYLACLAITHGAWAAKKVLKINRWHKSLQNLAMPVVFLITVQLTLWLPIMCASNTINLLSIPSNLLGTALSGHMLLMNTLLVLLNLKSQLWCTFFAHVNGTGFLLMDLINQFYKFWKGSLHYWADPKGGALALYFMGLLLVILGANTGVIKRLDGLKMTLMTLIVVVVAQGAMWYDQQGLTVTFFDVGQGDGLVLRTPKGHYIAFDCGPEKFDFQQALLNSGAQRLDRLYLTHGHRDHMGGLLSMKGKVEVQKVYMAKGSSVEMEELPELDKAHDLKDGETDQIDSVRIKAYKAPSGSEDENEKGVIYLISYGRTDLLITGDAGNEQQAYALKKMAGEGRTLEVLKLSHHGSAKSTSGDLLEGMKVGLVVVSVGKNNYGHPSKSLLETFQSKGVQTLRTDLRGCIQLKTDGRRIRVKTFKRHLYW